MRIESGAKLIFEHLGRAATESEEWQDIEQVAPQAEGILIFLYSEALGEAWFASCPLEPMLRMLNSFIKENEQVRKGIDSQLMQDLAEAQVVLNQWTEKKIRAVEEFTKALRKVFEETNNVESS